MYLGEKTSNPKHAGLSTDEAIGAVAGHEQVHASDKEEIHKDINYELAHKGRARREREEKPEKVESKIMEQILMKKKH